MDIVKKEACASRSRETFIKDPETKDSVIMITSASFYCKSPERVTKGTRQLINIISKVGDPQISSANLKSANCELTIFVISANITQMWNFADLRFAGSIFS